LISAHNLAKSFGSEDVFSGISLSVPQHARIAIVGANGIGKTSLLRVLAGLDEPSAGNVHKMRRLSIGYLPQEASFAEQHTLWEECLRAFDGLVEQEVELRHLEGLISDSPMDGELLERYGKRQETFDHAGGYTFETRIRQTLTGLGFKESEYEMSLTHLSGGQRTRSQLARLLLSNPDLLILDEPTNHLDINAVEWLEGYMRDWEGAAVIVSHDRYFLDKVVDHIWEMSKAGFELYRGNYSAYLHHRQERWEERQQFILREKERLLKELDYIRRNIAKQNTLQAKGRLRRLSRQIRAIEEHGFEGVRGKQWHEIGEARNPMSVEEASQRLKALSGPSNRPLKLHLNLRSQSRSGNIILRAKDLMVGYPGNPLFSIEEIELRRLECAALIGPNGAGKTTFLHTMLGNLPPLSGELHMGAGLKVGYFAQAHEDLNQGNSIIEEIETVSPKMLVAEIRNYLGRFMFSGDDHYKKVSVLSGGERGRLALAKLALTDANLLLLDEPTNHLDIPSQEVLQAVISSFDGTVIIVSHDRYLIDALATRVWIIMPDESALTIYDGTYSEYKRDLQGQLEEKEKEKVPAKVVRSTSTRNRRKSEERKKQVQISKLEALIHALEEKLAVLGKQLEDPPTNQDDVIRLGEEYAYLEKGLAEAMKKWEDMH
jgi:ATP-binding cassette subfamily F protein 3